MEESKVEITGFLARHYDFMLNFLSLGFYESFIKNAIARMKIAPDDRIVDMGCGTGRNSCLMAKYLTGSGSVVGLEIGAEMIEQFEEKRKKFSNIEVKNMRIDEPLPFENQFDKALLSFVFHGFPDIKKEVILNNIKRALTPGGQIFILDYCEFDLANKSFLFRWFFQKFECRLALDYLKVDWKKKLSVFGFGKFEETFYFKHIIRLLKAELEEK